MMRFIINYQYGAATLQQARQEVLNILGGQVRILAKNCGQLWRFVISLGRPFVQLMDIGQVKRSFRMCPLALSPNVRLEIPHVQEFWRYNLIGSKDSTAAK